MTYTGGPFHDEPKRRLMLVDLEDGSYRDLAPTPAGQSYGKGPVPGGGLKSDLRGFPRDAHDHLLRGGTAPAPVPVPQGIDPWAIAHEFPERWRSYLHAHFRNHMAVAKAFEVCEKAARKWWDGTGSCRGDKVVMACRLHPTSAPQMLFGEAA